MTQCLLERFENDTQINMVTWIPEKEARTNQKAWVSCDYYIRNKPPAGKQEWTVKETYATQEMK